MTVSIYAAWIGFLLGCMAGAVPGLFFHDGDWLGGYTSWSRRMIRLAHISFFGIGFLNLAFALTTRTMDLGSGLVSVSFLFVFGAVTMPAVCYLSAWKPAFRRLFFIPALSILLAVSLFTWRLLNP